ncbi:hypothetical protein ABE504_24100 [Paenibacillus oryzisoli]|uniref:hypothetical protein n=1 Tax=Paenibacillus oryzisoli TaxID=1850517 RepID=UPI003D268833
MEFELAHEAFVKKHVEARSGERKGRLERGHREAEKLFCREVGGRCGGSSTTFIRNSKYWIGAVVHFFVPTFVTWTGNLIVMS